MEVDPHTENPGTASTFGLHNPLAKNGQMEEVGMRLWRRKGTPRGRRFWKWRHLVLGNSTISPRAFRGHMMLVWGQTEQ